MAIDKSSDYGIKSELKLGNKWLHCC